MSNIANDTCVDFTDFTMEVKSVTNKVPVLFISSSKSSLVLH